MMRLFTAFSLLLTLAALLPQEGRAQTIPGFEGPPTTFTYNHRSRISDSRDGGHVLAASTVNIPALFGIVTIDGYTPAIGDLVLLTQQSDGRQNGLWRVTSSLWERPDWYSDAPISGGQTSTYAIAPGAEVYVENGTLHEDCYFHLAMPDPAGPASIIVDTTPTRWEKRKKVPECDLHQLTVDISSGLLPTTVPDGTDILLIDVINLSGDLDITAWKPTGLDPCAKIRLRKADDSTGALVFDDGVYRYSFASQKGEFFCLLCDGADLHLF